MNGDVGVRGVGNPAVKTTTDNVSRASTPIVSDADTSTRVTLARRGVPLNTLRSTDKSDDPSRTRAVYVAVGPSAAREFAGGALTSMRSDSPTVAARTHGITSRGFDVSAGGGGGVRCVSTGGDVGGGDVNVPLSDGAPHAVDTSV